MTFQVESGESWSRSFHRKHPPTCMQSSWKVGGHLQVQSLAAPELFGHGKGSDIFGGYSTSVPPPNTEHIKKPERP